MFAFLYSKTAISFNILLVLQILYLRNSIIFSGPKFHLHTYHNFFIQCIFLLLLMVWRYQRQNTDKTLTLRKIYEYASERAETIFAFHIKNGYFFQFFVGIYTSDTLSQKHIIFRSQITSAYIIQCSFLLLLLVWRYYKRQYTDKTLTLRKIYDYTSELGNFPIFTF